MKTDEHVQQAADGTGSYAGTGCRRPGKHRGFGFRYSRVGLGSSSATGLGTSPSGPALPSLLAVLTAACLAGCGVETPPAGEEGALEREAPVEARPRVALAGVPEGLGVVEGDEEGAADWLSAADTRDPVAWLEGFDASPAAGTPERRAALLELIGRLNERYIEDPRMLANRTVQLQGMLAEVGVTEDMHVLLRGFADQTQGVSAPSFGEMVGFYVNLRAGGASHAEAMQALGTGEASAPGGQGQPSG